MSCEWWRIILSPWGLHLHNSQFVTWRVVAKVVIYIYCNPSISISQEVQAQFYLFSLLKRLVANFVNKVIRSSKPNSPNSFLFFFNFFLLCAPPLQKLVKENENNGRGRRTSNFEAIYYQMPNE